MYVIVTSHGEVPKVGKFVESSDSQNDCSGKNIISKILIST
jgi:hypothetical protein